MPSYEMPLILRSMNNPETKNVLKRVALNIINTNGLLFKMENLGQRKLPHAIRSHGEKHLEGRYFLFKFDYASSQLGKLTDELVRDVDLVRFGIVRQRLPPSEHDFDCQLEEELKAPAYRKDVKEMIEKGRKEQATLFKLDNGLGYNPFRT